MMKQFLAISLALVTPALIAQETSSPMNQLDWLVGEWTFDDVSVDGSYRETGSRNCDYTLHRQYILCESLGTSHSGTQRSYLFYFNYNPMDERFEIVALNSHYPRKNLYRAVLSEAGHRLDLISESWSADGLISNNAATITYDGENQYVWEIRSGEPNPQTGIVAVSFRDTVTRVR